MNALRSERIEAKFRCVISCSVFCFFLLFFYGVATRSADEIRHLVCKDAIVTTFATVPVTVSMGITVADRRQNLTIEELLQQTDALYSAKENGRNCVQKFVVGDQASRGLLPTSG